MNTYDINVFLEDTDAGGIVYHSRYLNFMERARTVFFYHKGIDHGQLIASNVGSFLVTHIDIHYLKPARLGDVLTVTTNLFDVRGASLLCEQRITRQEQNVITAKVKLAFVNPQTGLPLRIPKTIQQYI